MSDHFEKKCCNCFHFNACKEMMKASGIVVELNIDASAERCDDFLLSAEVPIVRHGNWRAFTCPQYLGLDDYGDPIYRDGVVYYCSKCGRRTVIKEKYCPSCGAKMDS